MRQTYANLGYLGMTSIKAFGILVEAKGEGHGENRRNCQNRVIAKIESR
jgi:hypothetical protein